MYLTLSRSRQLANRLSYNTHAIHASTHPEELERLREILEQIEDNKAAQLSPAPPHEALDRAGLRVDYKFALRHYIDSAASRSGMKTPATPSFQVSALETSSSLLMAEYYTAHTSQTNTGQSHRLSAQTNTGESRRPSAQTNTSDSRRPSAQGSTGESRGPSRKCTQILVRNVGMYQTMAFQVAPEYTIQTIKSLVRERIGLENARFQLLYSGKALYASDKSIGEYGIPHDATLSCTSFRPTTLPLSIVIMRTRGTSFRLSVNPNSLVRQIKGMCAARLAIDRPEDIRLIYAGKQLGNYSCLSDYGIDNESILYLVPALEDAETGAEKDLLESSKPQEEDLALPRSSEAKTPVKQVLSFWKAPFGAPWIPTRRVYYGLHRVGEQTFWKAPFGAPWIPTRRVYYGLHRVGQQTF